MPGANPNLEDFESNTAVKLILTRHPASNLMEALAYNDLAGAKKLIATGADVNVADFMGRTLADLSETVGNVEFVQLLQQYGAIHGAGFQDKDI